MGLNKISYISYQISCIGYKRTNIGYKYHSVVHFTYCITNQFAHGNETRQILFAYVAISKLNGRQHVRYLALFALTAMVSNRNHVQAFRFSYTFLKSIENA